MMDRPDVFVGDGSRAGGGSPSGHRYSCVNGSRLGDGPSSGHRHSCVGQGGRDERYRLRELQQVSDNPRLPVLAKGTSETHR